MTNSKPFEVETRRKTLEAAVLVRAQRRAQRWYAHGRAVVEQRLERAQADLARSELDLAELGEAPRDGESPSRASRWAAACGAGCLTGIAAALPQPDPWMAAAFFAAIGGGAMATASAFEEWLRETSGVAHGLEPQPATLRLARGAALLAAAAMGGACWLAQPAEARLDGRAWVAVLVGALAMLATLLLATMRYAALAKRRHAVQVHAARRRSAEERVRACRANLARLAGEEGAAIVDAADEVGDSLAPQAGARREQAGHMPDEGEPFAKA